MYHNDIKEYELMKMEHSMLREELNSLKKCQVGFLTLAISGSGLLLGLIGMGFAGISNSMLFLTPLVIVIPFWWIFFDKATSITRIVGYYRILENKLLGEYIEIAFLGWENALSAYRNRISQKNEKPFIDDFKTKAAVTSISSRYWFLVFFAFSGISVLCVVLSYFALDKIIISLKYMVTHYTLVAVASLITIISFVCNFGLLLKLRKGICSYAFNEFYWKHILNGGENDSSGATANQKKH